MASWAVFCSMTRSDGCVEPDKQTHWPWVKMHGAACVHAGDVKDEKRGGGQAVTSQTHHAYFYQCVGQLLGELHLLLMLLYRIGLDRPWCNSIDMQQSF